MLFLKDPCGYHLFLFAKQFGKSYYLRSTVVFSWHRYQDSEQAVNSLVHQTKVGPIYSIAYGPELCTQWVINKWLLFSFLPSSPFLPSGQSCHFSQHTPYMSTIKSLSTFLPSPISRINHGSLSYLPNQILSILQWQPQVPNTPWKFPLSSLKVSIYLALPILKHYSLSYFSLQWIINIKGHLLCESTNPWHF